MKTELNYQYCPQCAGKFHPVGKNSLVCEKCDFHYYVNARPTNAVILENEHGDILLVERKFDPGKGLWDLPGGFIDINETAEESMSREAQEELGVTIKNIKYISSSADLYTFKGITYNTICFIFTAQTDDTEIKPADDAASFQFFPKNRLPLDKIAFPSLRKALEEYIR
jgi:NAD+ diphosphatase